MEIDRTKPTKELVKQLVQTGMTDTGMAEICNVERNTIGYHMKNLFKKYGVSSRTQLILALAKERTDEAETAIR